MRFVIYSFSVIFKFFISELCLSQSLFPQTSPFFIYSFSYHFIDYLKSICVVFFLPTSSVFPLPSLLHAHSGVKGIALAILQLFKNTHTHGGTELHSAEQKKIHPDVISADRTIDRQQYSHDTNDSPLSLSQMCVRACSYRKQRRTIDKRSPTLTKCIINDAVKGKA